MKLQLTPKCVYGSIQLEDIQNKVVACKINGKWYPTIDTAMFDAGFCNIACMTTFIENLDMYEESLKMLGYYREGNTFVNNSDPNFRSEINIRDDGVFHIDCFFFDESRGRNRHLKHTTSNFEDLTDYVVDLFDKLHIDVFTSVVFSSKEKVQHVIESAISTRDLAKNLVRVKSSNLWSYGINIKDRKDKTGDVLVQFKDTNGGPGDMYQYLDVPTNIWRKWLAAPSKGSFLWKYIRDKYPYRKLTGDKRGKLPNAIN